MKNNKNGFTLIELLAVIVILAILAGITAIMVTNYIENSKINAFTYWNFRENKCRKIFIT